MRGNNHPIHPQLSTIKNRPRLRPCPSSEQLNSVPSLMSVDCDVDNGLDKVTSLPSDHVEAQLVESDSEDNPNPLLATSSTNRSFFENKRAPHRPYLKSYPKKKQGDMNRSFNPKWYQDYKWMEYCEECDACFCFACFCRLQKKSQSLMLGSMIGNTPHLKVKVFRVTMVVKVTTMQ